MATLASEVSAQTPQVLGQFNQVLGNALNKLGDASVDFIDQDRAASSNDLAATVNIAEQLLTVAQSPDMDAVAEKKASTLERGVNSFLTSLNRAQSSVNKSNASDTTTLSALTKAGSSGRKIIKTLLKIPGAETLLILEERNSGCSGVYAPGTRVTYRVHTPTNAPVELSIINTGDAMVVDEASWTSSNDFNVVIGPDAGGARVTARVAGASSTLPLANNGRLRKGKTPVAPSDLIAVATSANEIDLSWSDNSKNKSGFQIQRAPSSDGPWTPIALVGPGTTTFANTGLAAATTYYYLVLAYNASGSSAPANIVSAYTSSMADTQPPFVPTGLKAAAASTSQVNLVWSASTDAGGSGLAGYKVFRGTTLIATITGTNYTDTGLSPSTQYCYTVAAYDKANNTSTASSSACATTQTPGDTAPPSTPNSVAATAVSSNQINLSWSACADTGGSGLAGYKVFRGSSQIATTAGTSYSDGGLTPNSQYCYTVLASDNAGNISAQSPSACATTLATIPVAPSNLQASAVTTNQINLSWADNANNETGFKVERALASSGPWTQVGTTGAGATSYSSTGLSASTTYYYRVRATNSVGDSANSTVASATTPAAPDVIAPSVPTGLSARAVSTNQINVTWSACTDTGGSGLAGYKIYRGGVQIGTSTTTNYSSTGLSPGTLNCYSVAAYDNSANTSTQSSVACAMTQAPTDTTAPSVPGNIAATALSSNQIMLSWSAATDTGGSGLAGYKIYRSGTQIVTTSATTYTNTGLSASTQYCYTIAAYDSASNTSPQSSQSCATTQATIPGAPSNLAASAVATNQINLTWTDNASNETGFKVERATASGGPWAQIGTTGAGVTSYASTGLNASTTYYYRVRATNSAGDSVYSAAASATTTAAADGTAPSVPTGLAATAVSTNQINVTWSASADTGSSGLAGYKVYRGGVQIGTSATASYTDSGLSSGTQYCYTVTAYDNAGNASAQSSQSCATTPVAPSAPSNLAASAVATNQINLTWMDNANNETGFKVERATASVGPWTQVGTTGAGATSYSSTGLSASTTYYYRVRATNSAGDSTYSAVASATTSAAPDTTAPTVPTGLTATAVSTNQVNLAWSAATDTGGSGLAGYKIYRGGVQIATSTTTSYSNSGLSPGAQYCYTVAAYDNANNTSAQSASVCATTQSPSDTTAPTVSMTAPSGGSLVRGTITVSGNANDNVAVSKVEFYRDGGVLIATDTSSPFSINLDTTTITNGVHSLYAKAYDAASNVGTSVSTTITVDNAAPTVTLTSPTNGSTVSNTISITATASDNVGVIKVEFYRDSTTLLGTYTTAPYSMAFNTTSIGDGSHTFFAKAYDAAGNAGFSSSTSVTVKNSGGQPPADSWVEAFGASGAALGSAVATDANGNIVFVGYFMGTVNFGGGTLTSAGSYDIFVAKYSSSGTHIWSKRFGNTTADYAYSVAVDRNGDVIVTGNFHGTVDFGGGPLTSVGSYDIFLLKLSGASGAHLWSKRFGYASQVAQISDYGYAVATDPNNGDIVLTGNFLLALNLGGTTLVPVYNSVSHTFVARFSTSGAHVWSKTFDCKLPDTAHAITVDGSGNVLVAGEFYGTSTSGIDFGGGPLYGQGDKDIFVVKLSTAGDYVWARSFGGSQADSALGLAADSSGDIVFTGMISGNVDMGGGTLSGSGVHVFVAKLAGSTGAHSWSKTVVSTGSSQGNTIAVNSANNAIVVGQFDNTCNFGGGSLTSAGGSDLFVAEFSGATGNNLSAERFGGAGTEYGLGASVGADGSPMVTGSYSGVADFGGVTLSTTNFSDGFLLRLTP